MALLRHSFYFNGSTASAQGAVAAEINGTYVRPITADGSDQGRALRFVGNGYLDTTIPLPVDQSAVPSTKTFIGTDTSFHTELTNGQQVNIGGELFTIDVISSANQFSVEEEVTTEIVDATVSYPNTVTLSGVVNLVESSTSVIGTATAFLTELAVNDVVTINGNDYTVSSITDDSSFVVVEPALETVDGVQVTINSTITISGSVSATPIGPCWAVCIWADITLGSIGTLFDQHDGINGVKVTLNGDQITLQVDDQITQGYQTGGRAISSFLIVGNGEAIELFVNGEKLISASSEIFPALMPVQSAVIGEGLLIDIYSLFITEGLFTLSDRFAVTSQPYFDENLVNAQMNFVPLPVSHFRTRTEVDGDTGFTYLKDEMGYRDLLLAGNLPSFAASPDGSNPEFGFMYNNTGQWSATDPSYFAFNENLTISFWVMNTDIATRDNVMDKCYGGEFAFSMETSSVLTAYNGQHGTYSTPYLHVQGTGFQNNVWIHVTYRRDVSTGNARMYINGVLNVENTGNYSSIAQSNYPYILGGGYINQGFRGAIAEVKFWEEALTDDQILVNFSNEVEYQKRVDPKGFQHSLLPSDTVFHLHNVAQNVYDLPDPFYWPFLEDDQHDPEVIIPTFRVNKDWSWKQEHHHNFNVMTGISADWSLKTQWREKWHMNWDEKLNAPGIDLSKRGFIRGTISDETGTPVITRVRLYERKYGTFIREVWSDAGGQYEFDWVNIDIPYTILAVDVNKHYNSVIADYAIPEAYTND